MLLDLLYRYLRDVEAAVRELEGAYVERYEEEILAANRVNLRIRVRCCLNKLNVIESRG